MSSSLQEFLHQHRVGGNEIITHTSIQPNGKYFIPNEETVNFIIYIINLSIKIKDILYWRYLFLTIYPLLSILI